MESALRHSSQSKRPRHSDVSAIQIFVPVETHLVPDIPLRLSVKASRSVRLQADHASPAKAGHYVQTKIALTFEGVQQLRRELVEVIDHELRFVQIVGGIAVSHGNGSKTRALCRDEAPMRVLDRDAFARPQRVVVEPAEELDRFCVGAGSGLLAGVSSAATTTGKAAVSCSRSSTRRISARSAPEAMAIGPDCAMRAIASRAPGKSTDASRSSASSRIGLARDQVPDLRVVDAVCAGRPQSPETRRHRRSRDIGVVVALGEREPLRRRARRERRGNAAVRCWR